MSIKYDGIRENRPYTYNDAGGQSGDFEEGFRKKCLKNADRTFSQGLQCQQINSLNAIMSLDDSVFISHSPQGCTGCSTLGVIQYRIGQAHRGVNIIKNPRVIATNLDQSDIILGGEHKFPRRRVSVDFLLVADECYSLFAESVDDVQQVFC